MGTLDITLHASRRLTINGQLLDVRDDVWEVRPAANLTHVEVVAATVWTDDEPVQTELRIEQRLRNESTGEIRLIARPVNLSSEDRRRLKGARGAV
jgi:hypothetical protein